jgi:hypothetical protein
MTSLETIPQIEFVALDDGSTGIEEEDVSSLITEPFDPTLIRVNTRHMTIDLLLRRIAENALDLSPAFQRKGGIWTNGAQSRLIESILIRIPIPAFYLDATQEDKWLVVDGLQRLTALKRFVIDRELELSGLEFLTHLNGKTYNDLIPRFKRRIQETEVVVYAIAEGTPPNVKFNIFKRINTGGLPLSSQEIRHALNQGQAADLLVRLSQTQEFREATAYGISDKRRADQECVLRFMAFALKPYTAYKGGDLDGFLNDTMAEMNVMPGTKLDELEWRFLRAMKSARAIFDDDAFRKRYAVGNRRSPINKALFEAWSINLERLSEDQVKTLVQNRDTLTEKFIELMNTREFNDAVSQGTGDPGKVRTRFQEVGRIIKETLKQ